MTPHRTLHSPAAVSLCIAEQHTLQHYLANCPLCNMPCLKHAAQCQHMPAPANVTVLVTTLTAPLQTMQAPMSLLITCGQPVCCYCHCTCHVRLKTAIAGYPSLDSLAWTPYGTNTSSNKSQHRTKPHHCSTNTTTLGKMLGLTQPTTQQRSQCIIMRSMTQASSTTRPQD